MLRLSFLIDTLLGLLIFAKLSGYIEWNWLTILSPLWLPWVALFAIYTMSETLRVFDDGEENGDFDTPPDKDSGTAD